MLKYLFSIALIFAQLFWCTGCITAPDNKIASDLLSKTKKIGVLDQTSHFIHGELAATTAFANADWEAPEPRLNTGDLIFAAVSEITSMETVRIDGSRLDGIRPIYKPRNLILMPGKLDPAVVKQIGSETNVDLLIIFSSAWSSDSFEMTSVSFSSQGIFSRRVFSEERDYVFFSSHIEVYDTRSGKLVKVNWSADGKQLSTSIPWRKDWHEYSSKDQQTILEAVSRVTSSAVKRSIRDLGL